MGMLNYAGDYEGYAPNGMNLTNYYNNWAWYLVNYNYVTTTKIIHCQSVPEAINWWWSSYGYRERQLFVKILSIDGPSKYYLLGDSSCDFNNNSEGPNIMASYTSWEQHYFTLRHLGRGNLGFLDGHAQRLEAIESATYGISYTFKP